MRPTKCLKSLGAISGPYFKQTSKLVHSKQGTEKGMHPRGEHVRSTVSRMTHISIIFPTAHNFFGTPEKHLHPQAGLAMSSPDSPGSTPIVPRSPKSVTSGGFPPMTFSLRCPYLRKCETTGLIASPQMRRSILLESSQPAAFGPKSEDGPGPTANPIQSRASPGRRAPGRRAPGRGPPSSRRTAAPGKWCGGFLS